LQQKARNEGKKFAVEHKEDIAHAAVNNGAVIANVVDRGDSVVNAAFQNN